MIKKFINLCFVLIAAFMCSTIISPSFSSANETDAIGQVTFNLVSSQDIIQKLQSQNSNDENGSAGVYVFVENIDSSKIYKFPLNQMNNYSGRFNIPYGNYRIIHDPKIKDGQYYIIYENVFSISNTSPIVELECNTKQFVMSDVQSDNTSAKTVSGESINSNNVSPDKDTPYRLSFQNILSIIVIIIVVCMGIYKRFLKGHFPSKKNSGYDD